MKDAALKVLYLHDNQLLAGGLQAGKVIKGWWPKPDLTSLGLYMVRGRGSEEGLKTLAQTYRPDIVDRVSKNQALSKDK